MTQWKPRLTKIAFKSRTWWKRLSRASRSHDTGELAENWNPYEQYTYHQ